ncbi:hypothetical protein Bca4012_081838 [Brassica carinata]
MKGRMFCTSQASTAICSSMDHIHKPTTTTVVDDEKLSGRAIDRHNPIIKDGKRSSVVDEYIRIPASPADGEISNKTLEIYKGRRSVTGTARKSTGGGGAAALLKLITNDLSLARKSFSCVARPASEFLKTPPGSTRYLLGSDPGSLTGSAGQDTVAPKSPDGEEIKPSMEEKTSGGSDQVSCLFEMISGIDVNIWWQEVMSRVAFSWSRSLFSKCLSTAEAVKQKLGNICPRCKVTFPSFIHGKATSLFLSLFGLDIGVTSFNIDFAAKKVTVTGDITPLGILDSISKVKNAQFWTAPTLPLPNLETPNP